MRFFRRNRATPPPVPSFGEWTLRSFAKDEPLEGMTFAQLEQVCSKAASLLLGAAFAEPEAAREESAKFPGAVREAGLLARRTADAFRAALADRERTVLAWPWDHLATRVAWEAARDGDASPGPLGDALWRAAAAYALYQREQLQHVITLWNQVAAGVSRSGARPDLAAMGRDALAAYRQTVGAA